MINVCPLSSFISDNKILKAVIWDIETVFMGQARDLANDKPAKAALFVSLYYVATRSQGKPYQFIITSAIRPEHSHEISASNPN